jgi:hypothetical protein
LLQDNLEAWAQAVGSFDEMLATRRARYVATLPEVEDYQASVDTDTLRARLQALRAVLERAETEGDGLALATGAEQEQWDRLHELGERIEALGAHPAVEEARTRQRFLQGVLHWELQAAVPARRWEVEKGLREVEGALEETGTRLEALERAKAEAPAGFEGYADRIAAAHGRIEALRPAVAEALADQEERIEALAIEALHAGQRRLKTYAVQARFSLARIYDRVASDGGNGP